MSGIKLSVFKQKWSKHCLTTLKMVHYRVIYIYELTLNVQQLSVIALGPNYGT